MFGGGEEYFAPPEEVDPDSIARFATFCDRLRRLEKPTKAAIEGLAEEADKVGARFVAKEIVAGVILRHIKTWSGKKQLCYWYLLDKLAKEHGDTFGYLFGNHLLDIGTDYIPWEVEATRRAYESLVEHWNGVFPDDAVKAVWASQKQRLYHAAHPDEAAAERKLEEEIWAAEEKRHQAADGLDQYEQPCLAYLQGSCQWGAECTMLHPPGLQGSLPPECRLGDWRCPGCGAINRHFRRRCFSCPREKPQYRKGDGGEQTPEEKLLSAPDAAVLAAWRQQFGYDPADEAEAVAHWRAALAGKPTAMYLEERRRAYQEKIVRAGRAGGATGGRRPREDPAVAAAMADKKHRTESAGAGATAAAAGGGAAVKVQLPAVPQMPPKEKVFYLAGTIVQRGINDREFAGHLFLLCKALPLAAADPTFAAAVVPETTTVLHECAKLVYTAYTVAQARAGGAPPPKHPATPFFTDVRRFLSLLPVDDATRADIGRMADQVLSGRSA